MQITKKAAIYARCSTLQQHVSNQLLELRATAERFGWQVVAELVDDGISGAKGRSDRPGFERLFYMVQRKECVGFMKEVQSAGVDLYIHQQAINTATPAGRMVFGIFSALGEYERELIRERINAGLNRARAEGKKLGRPSVWNTPQVINSVRLLREKQMPIHQIAKSLKIGVGTVSKILNAA
jgi:DNA invertase Pin-like site-specific DNA recombinase